MTEKRALQLMTYKPQPGLSQDLYYMAFPTALKEELFQLWNNYFGKKDVPSADQSLPTTSLKALLIEWLPGVVKVNSLKRGSIDDNWLGSVYEISPEKLREFLALMELWIRWDFSEKRMYRLAENDQFAVKNTVDRICSQFLRAEYFAPTIAKKRVLCIDDQGYAANGAYDVLPFVIANHLKGHETMLGGTRLHWNYMYNENSNVRELSTDPIFFEDKNGLSHGVSYCVKVSLATTPQTPAPYVQFHFTMHRWIPAAYSDHPYLEGKQIHAKVRVSEDAYCQIPISQKRGKEGWEYAWGLNDIKENIFMFKTHENLPNAKMVVTHPEKYAPKILLPIRIGMNDKGFKENAIGSGVSVADQGELAQSIHEALKAYLTDEVIVAEECKNRNKLAINKKIDEYPDEEVFRQWVKQCTSTDNFTLEIYGQTQLKSQYNLMNRVAEMIKNDFGENNVSSCMTINTVLKDAGIMQNELMPRESNKKVDLRDKLQRSDDLLYWMGQTNETIGAIAVLPGKEYYDDATDPKSSLRSGFGRSGRVVQCIEPGEENEEHRVRQATYDLYRQLGIFALKSSLDTKRMSDMYKMPCAGFHVVRLKSNILLQLLVEVDFVTGQTLVYCDQFSKDKFCENPCSYPKAAHQLAMLSAEWKGFQPTGRSMIQEYLHDKVDIAGAYGQPLPCTILVDSNMVTTKAWYGTCDKAIHKYQWHEPHMPKAINVGPIKQGKMKDLTGTGVRILRVRRGKDVPDYYLGNGYSSASGLFRPKDQHLFYGLGARPFQSRYSDGYNTSRIDFDISSSRRKSDFLKKHLLEIYPLQLQPGDDPEEWAAFVNGLRYPAIQYNGKREISNVTTLPIPLHLAKKLEEYLLD